MTHRRPPDRRCGCCTLLLHLPSRGASYGLLAWACRGGLAGGLLGRMSGSKWLPDPEDMPNREDLPVMGPRSMAVINDVMARLESIPRCPHPGVGEENFRFWVSWLPDGLLCGDCYMMAQEKTADWDYGCAFCRSSVGTRGERMTLKATDNVGMDFWVCEACINADFPGGLHS
jgi:hypothetical protein